MTMNRGPSLAGWCEPRARIAAACAALAFLTWEACVPGARPAGAAGDIPFTGTPEEQGLAIAREWDRRDAGFKDSTAGLKMILENAQGQTSTRTLRIKTLEVPGEEEGDRTLTVFDEPRDVAGTALLSFAHIKTPDDQWLYLPALKRVKRIASANKSGPFMGSEFAYEDFTAQEVAKYTYKYLRNEKCGELDCYVVEHVPVYEHSGYTKLISWRDTNEYRNQKIEFYDRKRALLKTLTFSKYERYLGRHWRPLDMYMENHQTGKKTRLTYDNYQFQTGLSESDFNRDKLKQVR
jgi:outer membrane lipoprotein-sorting protein